MEVTAAKYDGVVPPSSAMDFDVRSDGLYHEKNNRVIKFKAEPVAWTTNGSNFAAVFKLQECAEDLFSGMFVCTGNMVCELGFWDLKSKEEQSVLPPADFLKGVKAMGFVDGRVLVCGTKSVWVTPKTTQIATLSFH